MYTHILGALLFAATLSAPAWAVEPVPTAEANTEAHADDHGDEAQAADDHGDEAHADDAHGDDHGDKAHADDAHGDDHGDKALSLIHI